jgi:hypothetical protein
MAYHYKPLRMTSEMQLPESEATLDEAEHSKKLEETWQSLCIHGVSPTKRNFYILGHAPQFDVSQTDFPTPVMRGLSAKRGYRLGSAALCRHSHMARRRHES